MNRFAKLGSMALTALTLLSMSGAATAEEKPADGTGTTTRASSSKKQLAVKRLVFARGIDGHEPQEAATTFSAKEDRVYAFLEVENPGGEDSVNVVFQPPSGVSFSVPLKVGAGAAHFRTWAFTRRAHDAGEWTVVIRDPQGKVLARQAFTVTSR
jgi:hypothetical protein